MKGKIGLEEHFAIDDTLMDSRAFFPDDIWREVRERILDLHGRRLRLMDEFGMEMMILSLNAPAIQAIADPKRANEIARKANDYLAEQVTKRPDRFQALAALPLQDPDLATRELQRCVNELGMVGALANGFSQVGDPNTIAKEAKLPAAAITMTTLSGASRLAMRTARTPSPAPSAITGMDGPRTSPRPNAASPASKTPGRSMGGVAPGAKPSAGTRPPFPGRRTIANALIKPAIASTGRGHHQGGVLNPSARGMLM